MVYDRSDIKVDYGNGFILSNQQVDIIEAINIGKENVCIAAKSGASKSSTMQMALKDVTNEMTNGLFIAFNNKIASEAKKDNPDWIETSTIHSLAYKNIVAPNGLKLRNRVDFKDFDNLGYRQRSEAVKCINKYCQSDVTKVSDFCSDISIAESVKSVMNKMLHGDLPITHDAYLKWFSLYLQLGIISPNKVDVVICDEYQDFSPCMASIFLLYPSKQKIGVGDNAQRVNGFMGSSDALQKLMINPDFRLMELTSTQRCSPAMAMVAQEFCRTYIESDFTYSGNNTCDPSYDSQMYITRTNSELIEIIPYLQSMNIKFNMTRKVDIIYHSYLMIQFNAEREYNYYKENQRNSDKFKKEDIRFVESYSKYRKDEAIRMMVRDKLISKDIAADRLSHSLRDAHESYFSSKLKICSFAVWISMQDLLFEHQDMYMTAKSILMLVKNKVKIYDSYKYAKEIEKSRKKHSLIISTANSVKGLTTDIAFFSDGLNTAFAKERDDNMELIENDKSLIGEDPSDDNNEMKVDIANLYYMAFTRARYTTGNAKYISSDNCYPGSEVTEQDFMRIVIDSQKEGRI